MNTDKAQGTILAAMGLAVGMTTIDALVKGQKKYPAISIPFGGFVATAGLMAAAQVAPDAAALFSVLVLTTALFGPSGDTFLALLNRLSGTSVQGLKKPVVQANLDKIPNTRFQSGGVTRS